MTLAAEAEAVASVMTMALLAAVPAAVPVASFGDGVEKIGNVAME